MSKILIKNATVVNEGKVFCSDVLIQNERIEKISSSIQDDNCDIIDAEGHLLIPGVIDSHVHFREPGLTHKGTIYSESAAAIAGGVTSFMDMPNTIPNTTSIEELEEKYQIAQKSSLANYSFYLGVTNKNIDLCSKINQEWVCGVTDDGLYFNEEDLLCNQPEALGRLFQIYDGHLSLHCEVETEIRKNFEFAQNWYKGNIPFNAHSKIRSKNACIEATRMVLEIQEKFRNRLHILHVSTKEETKMLSEAKNQNSKLTFETCPQYLFFNELDYDLLKWQIKWNPAIKTEIDREYLLNALIEDKIDFIASDHAPHLISEKQLPYHKSMSGAPIIQFGLLGLLEFYHNNLMTIEMIVKKTSHDVAKIFEIKDRGYIREGYYADLVLIDTNRSYKLERTRILSKCGWSPLENKQFKSTILSTFVNGNLVFNNDKIISKSNGKRIQFNAK
jgi:dihydroorotase